MSVALTELSNPQSHCSNRTRRKQLIAEVAEIRDIQAGIFGNVKPEDITICDICIWFAQFGSEDAKAECYLVQHKGDAPPKGYCKIFLVDPEKDPRKGEVLRRLQAAQQKITTNTT